eukprot:Rhum_TRINITY_DN2238_c0_g1::Rhum_TRINITY_DN2238_c0_g1_i1::g.6479::m.6479
MPDGRAYDDVASPSASPCGRRVSFEPAADTSAPRSDWYQDAAPLSPESILQLVHTHEDGAIRPQVERACRRVADKITAGAQQGQRQFDFIVCRRSSNEVDDAWHRRQVMLWDCLTALGLENFELRTEFVDGRQSVLLSVQY